MKISLNIETPFLIVASSCSNNSFKAGGVNKKPKLRYLYSDVESTTNCMSINCHFVYSHRRSSLQ